MATYEKRFLNSKGSKNEIGHWLMPVVDIDNAQAPVPEPDPVMMMEPFVIRSPMPECVGHCPDFS